MLEKPVLYAIGCGGYPSEFMPELVRHAQGEGWDVCVIGTRMGMRFLDTELLRELTGYPVRDDYKNPNEPDVLPDADAFVVAPATFNTVNKVAGGISDNLALGLVNEAIGMGKPVILAPWPNQELVKHPAFPRSVELLAEAGVRFVLDRAALPLPASGRPGAATFPWAQVYSALAVARDEVLSSR
ncbi:flavoprotein [Catenulispora sp. NL8]|uniref:Flavoprotein n=1 Tax=Catenulispora pinistramenti TaxID=2705254 RepID=A0ABS5KLP7_9ACTN|nr:MULTISPECIES: flavoprotein [Catenulispora]MBS2546939.1 flavoprotein [Catenulispora pinistramenti]